MAAEFKHLLLTFLLTVQCLNFQGVKCFKIKQAALSFDSRWTLQRQPSHQNQVIQVQDEDALYIHTTSVYMQTVGSVWLSKIAALESNVTDLYVSDMTNKGECQWSERERQNWTEKLKKIKFNIENYTDTSDLLGIAPIKTKENLTDLASFSLSVTLNFEQFVRALYHDADSNFVIFKFAAFLREQMIRRQAQWPLCIWTVQNRNDSGQKIDETIQQFWAQMNTEVEKILQIQGAHIFREGDLRWTQEIFASLYEPFDF